MWPFGAARKLETQEAPQEKIDVEEVMSYAEAFAEGGMQRAMEVALEKSLAMVEYYQQASDQGSDFFSSEFQMRATGPRLKALYSREPWVFATASLIARTLASVPFNVVNAITDEVDLTHPLNKKLAAGSKIQDGQSMKWSGYLDLVLGGNFIQAFDAAYQECVMLPIENVDPKMRDDYTGLRGVDVYGQENSRKTFIEVERLVHHKFPNPYTPFWGMSIFTAASRPILLDRLKNEFEFAFYLRGGTSQGVVETTEDINKTRMKRLLRTFEQTYTGKRNWWRQIFLPKGAKFVQTGFTFDQLKHFEGLKENRLSFLAVLGVPPSKVGIVQDVNRATSETQDRQFWLNTIKPFAEFIAAGWNNSHLVRSIYQGAVKVVPNFSDIEPLQGSLITKGEQAKSVEGYFTINEIRDKIFKMDPLEDERGDRFVSEIRPAPPSPLSALDALSAHSATATSDLPAQLPPAELPKEMELTSLKAQAAGSQERIERSSARAFLKGYTLHMDVFFGVVSAVLGKIENADSVEVVQSIVQRAIETGLSELTRDYLSHTKAAYEAALARGFSFANANAKTFTEFAQLKSKPLGFVVKKLKSGAVVATAQKSRFDSVDQEAIDYLRRETEDGQRQALVERSITTFHGMSGTRTREVLDIIADGMAEGTTLEKIAETIRTVHTDRYGDQSFTIARTEVLSAVSQGIKWNKDVLQEVFTKVEKQWFHVGDVGSNPHARELHADFESEGAVPSDHLWGGQLAYPRDPSAPASETINCRCTMVSVIPDDSESNAEIILERVS